MRARPFRLASGRDPRWALWDRFEVPDYDSDGNYLVRIRIIQTPLFGIYLHRFDGPDPRPTLHDHPWNFTAIVLRGGYIERRLNPHTMTVDEYKVVKHLNRKRAHQAHAIVHLLRRPTYTLMFVGPRVRTWGYLEPLDFNQRVRDEWVWTEFDKHAHADEFAAAMERRKAAS